MSKVYHTCEKARFVHIRNKPCKACELANNKSRKIIIQWFSLKTNHRYTTTFFSIDKCNARIELFKSKNIQYKVILDELSNHG